MNTVEKKYEVLNAHLWPKVREGVELFHSGIFREGITHPTTGQPLEFRCTPQQVDQMVDNWKKNALGERPVLTPGVAIGHSQKDLPVIFKSDTVPQEGQILDVWAEDKEIEPGRIERVLLGDVGVNETINADIDAGKLVRFSSEIKRIPPDGCAGDGYTLVRGALLGFAPAGAKRLAVITTTKSKPNPSYQELRNKHAALEVFSAYADASILFFSDLPPWKAKAKPQEADTESPDGEGTDGEVDAGKEKPKVDRSQLLTWLTSNGFDPVALKIDFETPDDLIADLVDVLKEISCFDPTEDEEEDQDPEEEVDPQDRVKFGASDDSPENTILFGDTDMAVTEADFRKQEEKINRLTSQVGQLVESIATMNKNTKVLDREAVRSQIQHFCDRMVDCGHISVADAEAPTKENPLGGEVFYDLMKAANDPEIHKFADGVEKTALQIKMERIEQREPIYLFSDVFPAGGTGGERSGTVPLKAVITDAYAKKMKELERK